MLLHQSHIMAYERCHFSYTILVAYGRPNVNNMAALVMMTVLWITD